MNNVHRGSTRHPLADMRHDGRPGSRPLRCGDAESSRRSSSATGHGPYPDAGLRCPTGPSSTNRLPHDFANSRARPRRVSGSLLLAATMLGNGNAWRGNGNQPFIRSASIVGYPAGIGDARSAGAARSAPQTPRIGCDAAQWATIITPALCATMITGPSMSVRARSTAATRAAQLSLSCSSGATLRTHGSFAASNVCQCSATCSRRPGTIRTVGIVEAARIVSRAGRRRCRPAPSCDGTADSPSLHSAASSGCPRRPRCSSSSGNAPGTPECRPG